MSGERLLKEYQDEEEERSFPVKRSWRKQNASTVVLYIIVTCLVASNVFLYRQNQKQISAEQPVISKYARIAYDTPDVYRNDTGYMSNDRAVSDALWESIDTDPMTVALTDEWAVEHDLPVSIFRFPWDESKGLYFIKAWHGLHCLKGIYKAFAEMEAGRTPNIRFGHIRHCLDSLRQEIICHADDSPMPGVGRPNAAGYGVERTCRSIEKLKEWSQAPERNACFRQLSDFRPVPYDIERFAYCSEDSEYRPTMEAYFEKWGHRNPFGDDEV